MQYRSIIFLLFLSFLISCTSKDLFISRGQQNWENQRTPPDDEVVYEIFLVGDAGKPKFDGKDPVFNLLESMAGDLTERSAIVFLGDNLYPAGLPDSTHPQRAFYEKRLTTQMDAVKDSKAEIYFIPGNHDWNDGNKGGLERVREQEKFIEAYLDRGNVFLPDDGYPGPHAIKLLDEDDVPGYTEDIRLIAIDTQWWLHKHEKPYGDHGGYDLHDAGDFLNELEDLLRKYRKDNVLVAAHHPLFSNGSHGGRLPPSTHLKPPIFGSFYVLYRRFLGFEQDINHYKYSRMKDALLPIFSLQPDMIYASGHDHNLQLFRTLGKRMDQSYIVSGSASKTTYTANGRGTDFNYDKQGFAQLKYFLDGSIYLYFWAPNEDGSAGKLLYRTRLKGAREQFPDDSEEQEEIITEFPSGEAIAPANPDYDYGSKFTRFFVGEHHRDAWSIPVKAPVFNLNEVNGGMTPIRLGGRGQSNSLHLEDSLGRKYTLRSVDKVAGKIWSENLRRTAALKIVQDQFSYIHPYAALIVPPLADAAGVYHSNPKLFYVPDDPALGKFAEYEAGKLALLVDKPDGDMSHQPSFGRSEDVLSYRKMIRKLEGDIDHRVDQRLMARSRLFDMWIGDWDRHFDQWRWASFEPADEKGKIYKPIPRDRDVAFMKFDKLPSLAKLGPFFQYQDFRESYGNIKGLTLNSLGLTRRFTNQLTKDDWLAIADSLQMQLTNEVIDEAVKLFPEPVYEEYGERITYLLKVRREKLREVTETYYALQSAVVSIPGSNKREKYIVTRLDNQHTQVEVYKVTKKGKIKEKYFDRVFNKGETREIRIYGLGGDDIFETKGEINNGIEVLIIGGPGEDLFVDETEKKGGKDFKVFDTTYGNEYQIGRNTKVQTSNDPAINQYDYEFDYVYNRTLPVLFIGGNNDDGILLGGGATFVRNQFRRAPASIHTIKANHSLINNAFNLVYDGRWYGLTGSRGYSLNVSILSPNNIRNFFGLGNETDQSDRSINFYRARLAQYRVTPTIEFEQFNAFDLNIGPSLQITNVDRDTGSFLNDPQAGISRSTFENQFFAGAVSSLSLTDVDNNVNPEQGFRLSVDALLNIGIANTSDNFSKMSGDFRFYTSPSLIPQITIANRVGAAHIFGDFPFYEANTLGGRRNLRGFRSTRFTGRSSFFHNIELRAELFSVYKSFIAGRFGINGFHDVGRVWTDGESSNVWHQGYGGGVWFDFLEVAVINFDLGFSEEDQFYNFGLGFFF